MRRTVVITALLVPLLAAGCGMVPLPSKTKSPAEPTATSSTARHDGEASADVVDPGIADGQRGTEDEPVVGGFRFAPLRPGDVVPLPPPAEVLGEGIPMRTEPIDLATLDSLVGDPGPDGVWGVPPAFLAAWQTAGTTGDTTLMRRLAPDCDYCTNIVERIENGTDGLIAADRGYFLNMTLWPLAEPWGENRDAVGMAVRLLVGLELPADGYQHFHIVQDETIALDLDVTLTDDGWRVEEVQSWPWVTAVDPDGDEGQEL